MKRMDEIVKKNTVDVATETDNDLFIDLWTKEEKKKLERLGFMLKILIFLLLALIVFFAIPNKFMIFKNIKAYTANFNYISIYKQAVCDIRYFFGFHYSNQTFSFF